MQTAGQFLGRVSALSSAAPEQCVVHLIAFTPAVSRATHHAAHTNFH